MGAQFYADLDRQTDGRTEGWTDRHKRADRHTGKQADMTKLIVAFRNLRTRLKFRCLSLFKKGLKNGYKNLNGSFLLGLNWNKETFCHGCLKTSL